MPWTSGFNSVDFDFLVHSQEEGRKTKSSFLQEMDAISKVEQTKPEEEAERRSQIVKLHAGMPNHGNESICKYYPINLLILLFNSAYFVWSCLIDEVLHNYSSPSRY